MYYAYFTYGKGPVYLYDYIDKILQGGTKDATQMITDIDAQNIYINNSTIASLSLAYIESLHQVYSAAKDLIVKRNNTNNHVCDFVQTIEKLLPDPNYFAYKRYHSICGWKPNRQLFYGDEASPYSIMVNTLTRLLYCMGESALSLSFDKVYFYLSEIARKDFSFGVINNAQLSNRNISKIRAFFDQEKVYQDMLLCIRYYSLQESLAQQKIIAQFKDISSNLINGEDLYKQMCINRENLLRQMCEIYYCCGTTESNRHPQENKKAQREKNRQIFGTVGGFQIQKSSDEQYCSVCHSKRELIYDINIFTPHKNTLSSVCVSCLADIGISLSSEYNNRYSELFVNNLLMLSYRNYSKPVGVCDCCGSEINAYFKISSSRNPDFVVCKRCFHKLDDNISRKTARLLSK